MHSGFVTLGKCFVVYIYSEAKWSLSLSETIEPSHKNLCLISVYFNKPITYTLSTSLLPKNTHIKKVI